MPFWIICFIDSGSYKNLQDNTDIISLAGDKTGLVHTSRTVLLSEGGKSNAYSVFKALVCCFRSLLSICHKVLKWDLAGDLYCSSLLKVLARVLLPKKSGSNQKQIDWPEKWSSSQNFCYSTPVHLSFW